MRRPRFIETIGAGAAALAVVGASLVALLPSASADGGACTASPAVDLVNETFSGTVGAGYSGTPKLGNSGYADNAALTYQDVDGNTALLIPARDQDYKGIQTNAGVFADLAVGQVVTVSAKVRLADSAGAAGAYAKLVSKPGYGTVAETGANNSATAVKSGAWTTLTGTYTVTADKSTATIYTGLGNLSDGTTSYDYLIDDFKVTVPAVVCSTPTTVVSNGFETNTDGFSGRGATIARTTTETAHAGSGSLLVSGRTSASWNGVQTDVQGKFTAGQTYHVSAWVKLPAGATGAHQLNLGVNLPGASNEWPWVGSRKAVTADAWVHLEGDITADAATPAAIVYIEGDTQTDFLVDDFEITGPPAGSDDGGDDTPVNNCEYPTDDVVLASDFESGDGNWTPRDDGKGTATVAVTTDDHNGGTHSLAITERGTDGQGAGQDVTCTFEPGQTYIFDGYVRFGAGEPVGEVDLSYALTTKGSTSYSQFGKFTTVKNTGWTHVTQKFTVPSGDSLYLYFETKYNSGNVSDLYLDDLTFTKSVAHVQDITPIKDTVDFPVGAAVSSAQLVGGAGQLLAKHFDQVTAENVMKPEGWYNADHSFKTVNAEADALIEYAQTNHLRLYGHTLAWYQQTPDWFFQDADGNFLTNSPADQQTMRDRLKAHIDNVASYIVAKAGKFGSSTNPFVSFDVVNEVVSDNLGDAQGLRQSHWYQILGDEYIADAFRDAEHAFNQNPDNVQGNGRPVKLFINDYNTEQPGKRGRLLDLVNNLVAAEVPIDGVGHQFHVTMATPVANLQAAIDAFKGIQSPNGHELLQAVTELDVPTGSPVTDANLIDQGYYYKAVFDMLRAEKTAGANLFSVTVWGLLDGQSWRKGDGAPLLFDDDLQAKQAYYGVTDQPLEAKLRTAIAFGGDVSGADQTASPEWSKLPLLSISDAAKFQLRWSPDHLTVYVTVDDATSDATDAVSFTYGDEQTATVKRDRTVAGDGVTAQVTSTATGWKVVAHLPATLVQADGTELDVAVTDGATTTGWNTPGVLGSIQLVENLSSTQIPEAVTAPEIDGTIDDVWSDASTVVTSKTLSGAADGAKATVHQLWKGQYLYVLAEVTDTTPDNTSPNAYERDSLEIFTDPGNAKNGAYRLSDAQMRIGKDNSHSFGAGDSEENQGARLQSATHITDGGYIVEARVDLGAENTGVGTFQGVDYEVNDGSGVARISNSGWAEQTGRAYQTTARWGVAELVAADSLPGDGNGGSGDPGPGTGDGGAGTGGTGNGGTGTGNGGTGNGGTAPTGPGTVTLSIQGGGTTFKAGESVTLVANNLQPNEPVEVWIHSTPRLLARGTATAAGTYTVTVKIPSDLEQGAHTIEIRGLASGSTTTIPITVDGVLAITGAQVGGLLALALGLLGAGAALVVFRRQRLAHR